MNPEQKMRAALKAAQEINEKVIGEKRDPSQEEVNQIAAHLKDYESAKKEFEAGKAADDVMAQLKSIGLELGLEMNDPAQRQKADEFRPLQRAKSLGQLFTEGAEYKAFMASFNEGQIPEKARVQSAPMGLKHILTRGVKALLTGNSDTSGGAFISNDVQDILELLGRRQLVMRDLISVRQTTSDTVEYVQQTTQPTSAAPVAEATTSAAPTIVNTEGTPNVSVVTPAAGGGYKPEGSFAFAKVTATVKTIAEWVPATKRSLADVAQLRGLIDDELRADLAEEEEDQMVNGSGSGENLTGILNTSGIQTQAFSTDIITTLRKAKTLTRTVGRVKANGVMLNPSDAEKLDLAKGADQFYGPGPFAAGGIATVWGLPIVESEAIAAGNALVGDFSKAVLWDREQANITTTDSHADFFIRNLVAVLGEERVAFGVTRPKAFVLAATA